MGQLDGKVGIVTGSGRGIGREVALKHLDELKALVRKPIPRHEHERVDNTLASVA